MARIDRRRDRAAAARARLAPAALIAAVALAACHEDAARPVVVADQLPGQKIAFVSRRDGDEEIYLMEVDGSGLVQLTTNGADVPGGDRDTDPAFSPDGRLIVFESTRDFRGPSVHRSEIYVMRVDGTEQRRLTHNRRPASDPSWSPDGNRIVFATCRGTPGPICQIATMNGDGSDVRLLTKGHFDVNPLWSPDGSEIAFVRMHGESHFQHFEIHVMDADGSDERRLTDNDAGDGVTDWSPDGRRILFFSNRAPSARCLFHDCAGYTSELYVMDADGGNVERLTRSPHDDSSATWSPDGSRIVFSRILDEAAPTNLWVMNADGSCLQQLTAGGSDGGPDWYGPAGSRVGRIACER